MAKNQPKGVGEGTGRKFPSAQPDNPSRTPPSGKPDNRAVDKPPLKKGPGGQILP